MSTLTSGVLRNRFRILEAFSGLNPSGYNPEGFTHDDSRMPDKAVDLGTAVIAGSVWDGDNRAAETHFHIHELSGSSSSVSGTLELSDYKSHMTPGIAVLQAGIGDNADCILSGIQTTRANVWHPAIETGVFFDLETQLYLHSSGALESIISSTDLRTALSVEPQSPHPISMATFFIDKWGKAYVYEQFKQKVSFTSWSGLETLQPVANSDPAVYRPAYSGIRWYNVNTNKYEFCVDATIPELIRSRNITSGVHAILRTVPYSRTSYQLPLVPVVSVSGTPTLKVYDELVTYTVNSPVEHITNGDVETWTDELTLPNWNEVAEIGGDIRQNTSGEHQSPLTSLSYDTPGTSSAKLEKESASSVNLRNSSTGYIPNEWYRLEVHMKYSGMTGGDVWTWRIINNDTGDYWNPVTGTWGSITNLAHSVADNVWSKNILWIKWDPSFTTSELFGVFWRNDPATQGALFIDNLSITGPYEHSGIATQGSGVFKIGRKGAVSNLTVYSSGHLRISGGWDELSGILKTTPIASGSWFPQYSGILWIDDWNGVTEKITYLEMSGNFISGIERSNPVPHRDGARVSAAYSGVIVSGSYFTVAKAVGTHVYARYDVLLDTTPSFDAYSGIMTISGTDDAGHVDLDLTYYRGTLLCYEPSGLSEYNAKPALNINPLVNGNSDGILWFSTHPVKASNITVTASKDKDIDNIVGPVFAGNDYLTLTAKVTDRFGSPVPDEQVGVSISNAQSIGNIDGASPLDAAILKTTNSRGEARFVYTPPSTIHGLGYFTQYGNLVSGSVAGTSGIQFSQTFELKEMLVSGTWNALTFAVFNDDTYDTWSEISGALGYTADGRFEIISRIDATPSGAFGTYATLSPVKPTYALDAAGNILGTSGQVKTLLYTSTHLPTNETNIGAFFVSAEKQATVGIVAPNSKATSKTMTIKVGIPEFMKGELFFGPLTDVDTKSLDSLAYLTINPYTMDFIDEHHFDPRTLGNVFRIQGAKSDEYMRNKFYVIPDWYKLNVTANSDEVRKQFTFRNRFILEII